MTEETAYPRGGVGFMRMVDSKDRWGDRSGAHKYGAHACDKILVKGHDDLLSRLTHLLTRLLRQLGNAPGNTTFARRDSRGKFSPHRPELAQRD